jgi:hypothetical protein
MTKRGVEESRFRLSDHGPSNQREAVTTTSAGGGFMRKIWTVVIAIALGAGMGACSKCDVPDLLPKFCRPGGP